MNERLEKLRESMARHHMDAYLILTSDFHESEYVGEYFKCREYLTGFTGSAGTAVVTREEAGLWTDGRYIIQAKKQLEGSGFTLRQTGQEGTASVEEYLKAAMPEGSTLGVDGRTLSGRMGEKLKELLELKHVKIAYEQDLVGQIWEERPPMSKKPVWILDEKHAGRSARDKIDSLREEMEAAGADIHIITSLDDIAWLLNIRGGDIACNPVVLSYVIVTMRELTLFVSQEVLSRKVSGSGKPSVSGEDDFFHLSRGLSAVVNLILLQVFMKTGNVRKEPGISDDVMVAFPEGVFLNFFSKGAVSFQHPAVFRLSHPGAPGQFQGGIIPFPADVQAGAALGDGLQQRGFSHALNSLYKYIFVCFF